MFVLTVWVIVWLYPPLLKGREKRMSDQAYFERNCLVAALSRLFYSGTKRTDIPGWEEEWKNCVYIDLPTGQVSFHYHDEQKSLFSALPEYTKEWDGHTKDEAMQRIMDVANWHDVCMCGGYIKDHNIGSDHSPVCMWSYYGGR